MKRFLMTIVLLLAALWLNGCSNLPYDQARIRQVGDNNGAGDAGDRAGCLRIAQGPGPLKPVIIRAETGAGILGGLMFEERESARLNPPDLAIYEECLTKRGWKVTWKGGRRPGP